ncbi:MAG: hypothetical protein IT176_15990 [Acidobacteria bacterium]|nr:hypothetical protein [Acidobacteriota bacterium]
MSAWRAAGRAWRTIAAACLLAVPACRPRQVPEETRPPATAARPSDAQPQDWSLYANRPNAQDALTLAEGAIAAAHTDWPLVDVQLMELRRSGPTVSMTLALHNGGVEPQKPMFLLHDVHLVDPATGAAYEVLAEEGRFLANTNPSYPDRFYMDVDPGQTISATMTFAAPPPGVTTVDLRIPNVRPLEHLPLQG